jgi:hypothetical protein
MFKKEDGSIPPFSLSSSRHFGVLLAIKEILKRGNWIRFFFHVLQQQPDKQKEKREWT